MSEQEAWNDAIKRISFYGRLLEVRNVRNHGTSRNEWQARYVTENALPFWVLIGWPA